MFLGVPGVQKSPTIVGIVSMLSLLSKAKLQVDILLEASRCVKPGGRLIYGTCSLLHQENAGVVEAFEANEGMNFQQWPFKTGRWHGFFKQFSWVGGVGSLSLKLQDMFGHLLFHDVFVTFLGRAISRHLGDFHLNRGQENRYRYTLSLFLFLLTK